MSLLRHRTLLPLADKPTGARPRESAERIASKLSALLFPLLWIWLCAGAISLSLFAPLRTAHPLLGEPAFWLLGWPLCSLLLLALRCRSFA
jgi:hypothetical protein